MPAGSDFSPQEWLEAFDDGRGGRHVVFELRTGQECALIILPRLAAPRTHSVVAADGALARVHASPPESVLDRHLDPLNELMLDGCLLLGPAAPNRYPDAVSGRMEMRGTALGTWAYRIVRPEAHRADRSYLFGATGWVRFPVESSVRQMVALGAACALAPNDALRQPAAQEVLAQRGG